MGAKRALLLPVSAPFHSSLMKPAAEKLREKLATLTLGAPQIPVLNNIDVAIETDADRIRDALYRQAFGPVRWVEVVMRWIRWCPWCGVCPGNYHLHLRSLPHEWH